MQRAHFETRLENPSSDDTITWYKDGQVLQSANRIHCFSNFGFVSLDIVGVRESDAGTYSVVVQNSAGQDQVSASMVVETLQTIDTSSMHHIKEKEVRHKVEHVIEPPMSKPRFVQHLNQIGDVYEGKNIHLECRLDSANLDPSTRIDWYKDGMLLLLTKISLQQQLSLCSKDRPLIIIFFNR